MYKMVDWTAPTELAKESGMSTRCQSLSFLTHVHLSNTRRCLHKIDLLSFRSLRLGDLPDLRFRVVADTQRTQVYMASGESNCLHALLIPIDPSLCRVCIDSDEFARKLIVPTAFFFLCRYLMLFALVGL